MNGRDEVFDEETLQRRRFMKYAGVNGVVSAL
jgi:hypothetical protein